MRLGQIVTFPTLTSALPTLAEAYHDQLDLPPRIQWDANYGYCGEMSFIDAGLYYGQYISQYKARALASDGKAQRLESSQLLLGSNDLHAAKKMRLTARIWPGKGGPDTKAFLTWVKGEIHQGHPVIIGVYLNNFKFYGDDQADSGDKDYDHIVTVTGIRSNQPASQPARYDSEDIVEFHDHGSWSEHDDQDAPPQYHFAYKFSEFPATRRQANSPSAAVYSLPARTSLYGIAITGIRDHDHSTLPVRLTTHVNHELPAMKHGATTPPPARPVELTITIANLKPGASYRLYRYDSFEHVPDHSFNANAAKSAQNWDVRLESENSYRMHLTIQSDEIAVFRAVPTSAP